MSNPVIHRLTLDVTKHASQAVVLAKVGDTNRQLRIRLANGGEPYSISGMEVSLSYVPPSGYASAAKPTVDGDEIIWDFSSHITQVSGRVTCEVQIFRDANPLTSPRFTIVVDDTLYEKGSDEIGASAEYTAFVEQATWCVAARLGAAAAGEAANEAAATANAVAEELEKARENGEFNGKKGDPGDVGPQGPRGEQGPQGEPGTALIDDSAVGNAAWSSQKIVDKLCPSFKAEGTLVQCEPVEGTKLVVSAKEVPGVFTVTVCGKNLYNPNKEGGYPLTDGYFINNGNGVHSGEGKHETYCATLDYIPVAHLRGSYITLNHVPGGNAPGMMFYNADQGYLTGTGGKGDNILVPPDAVYMRFTTLIDNKSKVQIELGSESTEYEGYKIYATGSLLTAGAEEEVTAGPGINTVIVIDENDPANTSTITVTGKADPAAMIKNQADTIKNQADTIKNQDKRIETLEKSLTALLEG